VADKTHCLDCGKTTLSGGLRCRACHGELQRRLALAQTADYDRRLLEEVERDRLNGQRLATRYGISRTRATQKIALARRREEQRRQTEQVSTVTWREMCETVACWLNETRGTSLTGPDVWDYSPTGELAMIPEWYETAKTYYHAKEGLG